jgi:hypothetical protein
VTLFAIILDRCDTIFRISGLCDKRGRRVGERDLPHLAGHLEGGGVNGHCHTLDRVNTV